MRWIQRCLAILSAAVVAYVAWKHLWPFNTAPRSIEKFQRPSVWQYLLSDRYVLGLVRLGLAAFALYVAVSVPPLVAAARWVKGFGTSGVTADDAERASKTLEEYEEELADMANKLDEATTTIEQLMRQRDAALRLIRRVTSQTASTLRTSDKPVSEPIVGEEGITDDGERTQEGTSGPESGGQSDG